MVQQVTRLALQNADFPLLTRLKGRSVVIPNQDAAVTAQNRIPSFKPRAIYMHNVLPVNEGLNAIGYLAKLAAAAPAVTSFNEAWLVTDNTAADKYGLFSPASGANFFSAQATGAWVTNPIVPAPGTNPALASRGDVGGQTYICYPGTNIYTINATTGVLTPAAVVGITPATIQGITGSGNYLIAWDALNIYWSSPSNPLDFVSSLITGAGSTIPTDLRGQILSCYPYLNGFFIYTTQNIILAQYSGNAQYPWIFKEVAGSTAIYDQENVTHSATDVYNYAFTPGGFVRFSGQGTEAVFPEVSEFLSYRTLETYSAGAFSLTSGKLDTRITRVGSRYIVISYGIATAPRSFTHALVYDTSLQRWGKLKFTHVYCFAFPAWQARSEGPLAQIAFLASNGAVSSVNFGFASAPVTDAVVVIGGIAITRGTLLTLQEIDVDGAAGTYTVGIMPSANGKTFATRTALTAAPDGVFRLRNTALEHAIAIEGDFTLSSLQVTTTQAGLR